MTNKEREHRNRVRPQIVKALVALEKQFGESAVSGAFDRHRQIRRERRKLARAQAVINEKIRQLK